MEFQQYQTLLVTQVNEVLTNAMKGEIKSVAITLVAFLIFYNIVQKFIQLFDFTKRPPLVSGIIPFVGCLPGFSKNPTGFLLEQTAKHGDCFTLQMFGRNLTFFIGPEAADKFFNTKEHIASTQPAYRWTVPVFGPGVVYDCKPSKMREQMGFIRGCLQPENLKHYMRYFEEEIRGYLKNKWGDSGTIRLHDALAELTIVTASRALLGKEVRSLLDESTTAKLYTDLDKGFTPLGFFFPYLPIPSFKQRDRARLQMVDIYKNIMKKRRQNNIVSNDILAHLMTCKYKNGNKLTDDEIAGLMIALLLAGQHTSSASTTWMLLLLSQNKSKIDKILEEQKRLFISQGLKGDEWKTAPVNYDLINSSQFLHQCLQETLRMFPPIVSVMRQTIKDMEYKGLKINAGDLICASPSTNHRLPKYWSDVDTFKPERFNPATREDNKDYLFIPFGGGHHGCIGEVYAYLQIKAIMSIILREYDIEPAGPFPKPNYTALIVGPEEVGKHGFIKYTRRQ